MTKRHATDDVDEPDRTLCGKLPSAVTVDNIDPDCKTCLRSIAKRIHAYYAGRAA